MKALTLVDIQTLADTITDTVTVKPGKQLIQDMDEAGLLTQKYNRETVGDSFRYATINKKKLLLMALFLPPSLEGIFMWSKKPLSFLIDFSSHL